MKIYTKTGDDGTTGLFSGQRVPKNDSYIKSYGSVDELNATIGFVSAIASKELKERLHEIQAQLHRLCADLATPRDSKVSIERFSEAPVKDLEVWIDLYDAKLPALKNFILAGGCDLAARLHLARTVARRAERDVYEHSEKYEISKSIIVYLNRLSDLFFVLARYANQEEGIPDVIWKA